MYIRAVANHMYSLLSDEYLARREVTNRYFSKYFITRIFRYLFIRMTYGIVMLSNMVEFYNSQYKEIRSVQKC